MHWLENHLRFHSVSGKHLFVEQHSYSRRISIQHRFVYKVDAKPFSKDGVQYEGVVRVVGMLIHYEGL